MTLLDFAKDYAERLAQAIGRDAYFDSMSFTASYKSFDSRLSLFTGELKRVAHDIDGLTYADNRPLSAHDARTLRSEILRLLNLPDLDEYHECIKAGSVDSHLKVQQRIEMILDNLKKNK